MEGVSWAYEAAAGLEDAELFNPWRITPVYSDAPASYVEPPSTDTLKYTGAADVGAKSSNSTRNRL